MSDPEADIPLSVAIARLAAEIEALRSVSAELDGMLGALAIAIGTPDDRTLGALQGLDRMTQELTSLKPFIDRLSEVAAVTENPDASEALQLVRLGSLRARLSDASGAAGEQIEPGEPEFF